MIDLGNSLAETISIIGEQHVITQYIKMLPEECHSNYESDFGGHFFIIETVEELSKVPTTVEKDGAFLSAAETTAPYDVAEMVGEYIMLVLITNNSGGNSYFIPEAVWQEVPYVQDCIRITNDYWGKLENALN